MLIPLINRPDLYALVDNAWYPLLTRWRWRQGSRGYAETDLEGRTTGMHNLVLQPPPGYVTDHRNGIKLDNRSQNLRLALPHQNSVNRAKRTGASSVYHGVWRTRSGRYRAEVGDGVVRLGPYDSEVEAAIARDVVAFMLYGEFAALNFPEHFPPAHGPR